MTIDLNLIGKNEELRRKALMWVTDNYGSPDDGLWQLLGLRYLHFRKQKHATHFILRWS